MSNLGTIFKVPLPGGGLILLLAFPQPLTQSSESTGEVAEHDQNGPASDGVQALWISSSLRLDEISKEAESRMRKGPWSAGLPAFRGLRFSERNKSGRSSSRWWGETDRPDPGVPEHTWRKDSGRRVIIWVKRSSYVRTVQRPLVLGTWRSLGTLTGAMLDGRRGETPAWILQGRILPLSHFCLPCAHLPLSTVPGTHWATGSSDRQATSFMKPPIFCMFLFMTLNFHRKDLVLSYVCVFGPSEGVRSSWERKSNRKTSLLCKGSARAALVYQRLHIMPT